MSLGMHRKLMADTPIILSSGTARVTLFAASGNARTFDYSAGDVGYVPPSFGHYVENIGNDTLNFLEIFKSDRYQDLSLQQ
jgi:oxalate decarboxylase/phosphoglucose isomerase-like protein (cupin superfamily)